MIITHLTTSSTFCITESMRHRSDESTTYKMLQTVADARRTPVCWNDRLTKVCVVDSQMILTVSFILRCFLFEVFYEQSCVAAPGFIRLRQLVKELHCPGVYFEIWHRLVSKHWAEPAVNLRNVLKSNDEQDIKSQPLKSLVSRVIKNTTEHYLVDLFTHAG